MKPIYYKTLLILMFTALFNLAGSAQNEKSEDVATLQLQAENTIKLKITGINCSGDIKDIQKQVSELKGVVSCLPARKPAATTLFEVKFNPALVSEKEIRNAVESTAGCSDPDSRPYKVKL